MDRQANRVLSCCDVSNHWSLCCYCWFPCRDVRAFPYASKNWYHRVWKPALEAAGIKNFRFHDLRHTAGTRLGANGVRTRDIATALGHADERMAARYEHAASVGGHLRAVMQKLVKPPSSAAAEATTADATADSAPGAATSATSTPTPHAVTA